MTGTMKIIDHGKVEEVLPEYQSKTCKRLMANDYINGARSCDLLKEPGRMSINRQAETTKTLGIGIVYHFFNTIPVIRMDSALSILARDGRYAIANFYKTMGLVKKHLLGTAKRISERNI